MGWSHSGTPSNGSVGPCSVRCWGPEFHFDPESLMRTIGNILWLILAGFWLAIGYALSGLLICITIIGIPFGIQAFKLSVLSLWPFGRHVMEAGSSTAGAIGVPSDPTSR